MGRLAYKISKAQRRQRQQDLPVISHQVFSPALFLYVCLQAFLLFISLYPIQLSLPVYGYFGFVSETGSPIVTWSSLSLLSLFQVLIASPNQSQIPCPERCDYPGLYPTSTMSLTSVTEGTELWHIKMATKDHVYQEQMHSQG